MRVPEAGDTLFFIQIHLLWRCRRTMSGKETHTDTKVGAHARSQRLHAIIRELAIELEPRRRESLEVSPDSLLDRDLGIDSLARLELSLRIERGFGVRLPEQALLEAMTPADLLAALEAAHPERTAEMLRAVAEPVTGLARPAPTSTQTLVDMLDFHAETHPGRTAIRLLSSDGNEEAFSYRALWDGAQAVAAGLREERLEPGDAVAIMLPTGADFFNAFLGALLAGCIPTPVYPPLRRAQIEDHLRRQAGILRNARAQILIASKETLLFGRIIRALAPDLRQVSTIEELQRPGAGETRLVSRPDDLALLQYTSGSTGDPKGVMLTHANLLANIRALGQVVRATPDDVVVSWLPLYHDMGLIGNWLGSLYHACPVVVMSPLAFLARPERWLWAIHRYRGTLSAGPNFAYELCVRKIDENLLEGLDLGTWRMAGNGAEGISPVTLTNFIERFARYGFRQEAMTPMYGLAENAVVLTSSPLGRGPKIDCILRKPLAESGQAKPVGESRGPVVRIVSCGLPIPGHEVRIVDESGLELGEREEGRLEFRGPSATSGYLRNPAKTRELIRDGWLDSGDLAYIAGGEIYVTGRVKDIILRAGRNLYPDEIEAAVAEVPGVRAGRVAVFGHRDPASGTEGLVVMAETKLQDPVRREEIRDGIRDVVTAIADLPPDDILLARPGTILKTASGKIRRTACRELYAAGRAGRPPPTLWQQGFGLLRASLRPALLRRVRAIRSLVFAAWFWSVYRGLAPFIWLGVMALPGLRRRRALLRATAALEMRLIGAGPNIEGSANIPRGEPCVIVANHASYLDSMALAALLPPTVSFVAKRELVEGPVSGPFLRRLGTAFVERFDPAKGIADTKRLTDALRTGDSLVFYPEGTFDRMPGLRAFHMGAFVAAADAGVPVVPAGIRGTRSILRSGSSFPRRGRVTVTFCPPIRPEGTGWEEALRLRELSRQEILENCGEPDLAHEPKPI
jgi:1-acyl-sn-glycerol-3-phosphate acyltransferase